MPVSRSVRLNQALSASMAPPRIHCVGNFARYTWPPTLLREGHEVAVEDAGEPDAVTRAELFATRTSGIPATRPQSRSDA